MSILTAALACYGLDLTDRRVTFHEFLLQADHDAIERAIEKGEEALQNFAHPDPYIGESWLRKNHA